MNNYSSAGLLHPYVRMINVTDFGPVDFYIFNTPAASGRTYGEAGEYIKCERGITTFKLCRPGSSAEPLASLALKLEIGQVYTICAVGSGSELSLYAIAEPTEKANLEYGHLRICHLWPAAGKINVCARNVCFVGGIDYPEVTRYIEMTPGSFDIEVQSNQSGKKLLACGEQNLKAGKYNTLYILQPKDENSEPTALFTVDAASYSGFYL